MEQQGKLAVQGTKSESQKVGGSRTRRDKLLSIERTIQNLWDENHCFEADALENDGNVEKNKYFATFPYPYMNGRLHLGHAFSFSKCEFACRFQRLLGKHVLLPFSFHCTGMPIPACANRLNRELKAAEALLASEEANAEQNGTEMGPAATNSRTSKLIELMEKLSDSKSQWNIMKSMGVSEEEIFKFRDASYWLRYFPPHAKRDLQRLGCGIDWRRTFVTTDLNPFYDAFVQWQFRLLKKKNKIKFGSRVVIFSRLENQPCADHDRLSGENVLPMEYTLIKLTVVDVPIEWKANVGNKPVVLLAATLRPETMYGQTNSFVLPEGVYGFYLGFKMPKKITETKIRGVLAVELSREEAWQQCDCVYVCASRAALNMSYQGILPLEKQNDALPLPHQLLEVEGRALVGLQTVAPNALLTTTYVLPMSTVLMDKGTGIVTSVPSDSPDDYATFLDLKKKINYYGQEYGVKPEWLPDDVVEIIAIGSTTRRAAAYYYDLYKISSPKDLVKLKEAKDIAYQRGYYEGVMLHGPFAGQKVQAIKQQETDNLIERGLALVYNEPERKVVSRSWEECIAAMCDQWFLTYGEEKWAKQISDHLESPSFTTYADRCMHQFQHVITWLKDWACSRQYGLGTVLPWEREEGNTVYIESLSDSTIYMALYTIFHLLSGNSMYGDKCGKFGITVADMTDEAFDYIFLLTDTPPSHSCIPIQHWQALRNEFSYWYPFDVRCSGKDLIFNHLTMSLYNHAAIWEAHPSLWPRSFFCNGHILVDAAKMSKSAGNFLTLHDITETFSADASRIAFADAGDTLDDANFSKDTANSAIMRLYLLEKYVNDAVQNAQTRGGRKLFCDLLFENEVIHLTNLALASYENMHFREALKYAFYDFQSRRDQYKLLAAASGMHEESVSMAIQAQLLILSPIAPHICEHLWSFVLKKPTLIANEKWPVFDKRFEPILHRQYQLILNTMDEFRKVKEKVTTPATGRKGSQKMVATSKTEFSSAVITVAKAYLPWQQTVLTTLLKIYKASGSSMPSNFISILRSELEAYNFDPHTAKQALAFANYQVKEEFPNNGSSSFDLELPFDEIALFESFQEYYCQSLGLKELSIVSSSASFANGNSKSAAPIPLPGRPCITFV